MEENKMKNIMRHKLILALLLFLTTILITTNSNAQVICNKFKLVTNVTGNMLDLSVDTDLPDNTVIMISVSRSYFEKDNTANYPVDYFTEKSSVGKWKSKHRISINSENWKSTLSKKQKKMSSLGLGFDVASISDNIIVSMVVPINQPDPLFGKRNSKLTGKVVNTTNNRVIEDEIEINYPLDTQPEGKFSFQNVNYTIIDKSNMGNIKSSIDIRLEKKVTKEFLHKLALNLRKLEPRKYDRLFISYYLSGMKLGSGAWATTHFNPNLAVIILGTTIEEEKKLKSTSEKNFGEIIGKWLDDSPYVGAKYTLLKRNGKIFIICKYKDGSGFEKEMIQKKQSGKLRFEEKGSNGSEDYYLIERNENLGIYDNYGLIRTIRSIK